LAGRGIRMMQETVWAWLDGKWTDALLIGGSELGCGSALNPSHKVRVGGENRQCYCVMHRNPESCGGDRPTHRVWVKGEAVWARLKAKGWTKARMYSTSWWGDMASVFLGKSRGPESYLVDRRTGLRPRDPSLSGRDKPAG